MNIKPEDIELDRCEGSIGGSRFNPNDCRICYLGREYRIAESVSHNLGFGKLTDLVETTAAKEIAEGRVVAFD